MLSGFAGGKKKLGSIPGRYKEQVETLEEGLLV